MKLLSFVSDIFRKFPWLLMMNAVLVAISAVLEASIFVAVGPLVDLFLHPDLTNISQFTERLGNIFNFFGVALTLNHYLIFFVMFILISCSLSILARYSIEKVRVVILSHLISSSFFNCFNAKWEFFTSSKKGVLLNTFMKEIYNIGGAFDDVSYLFSLFIQIIFFLAVPLYISWQITLISCLVMILFAWPFLFVGKLSYKLKAKGLSASNQIAEVIMESFSLAKVILGFGNQDKSYRDLKFVFAQSNDACVKYETVKTIIPILYQPCAALILAVTLLVTGQFQVATSDMVVIFLSLLKTIASMSRLVVHQNALSASLPSYEQYKKLNNRALELKQFSGAKVFEGFRSNITIRNMSFAYPEHEPVLVDINMKFPKGNMIAIVGESGAGKSTLIDLIMGFHEPSGGQIFFDGVNLKEFNINSYRKKIGYVPQDCVLFNTTIKSNLLWAKETATDEEIVEACKQANAYEFIQKLPDDFGTVVGDRGVRLSGGQNQRMALARAILRNPELLILDEATSALDTHSERLIQEAIENIAKKTNVIVIAHRLSTIVNADYIYVLQNGSIVEEGNYNHLVASEGCFSRMIHLQTLEKSVL